MTLTDKLSLVECPSCYSHMDIRQLSSHVCLFNQPYRFSQISHYNSIPDCKLIKQQDQDFDFKQQHPQPQVQELSLCPLLLLPEILEQKRAEFQRLAANKKNRCSRCHRFNAAIHMAEKYYHTRCFSCFYCRQPFYKNNNAKTIPRVFKGQIYCNEHYQVAARGLTCATCKNSIESFVRPTIALGHYFHPEHIRCHHCHKPVDPLMTGIKERKGNIYCQTDYNQLFLPKCQSCHKPIEKEAVVSSDGKLKGKWHKYCFKCQLCQSSFVNNQFYIYNQQPYCKLDYHKLNNTLCHSCSLPVEGECAVTSEGWRFHPSCFTCHACKTNIHHVYYVYNNHVYCQDHIPLNNIPNFS